MAMMKRCSDIQVSTRPRKVMQIAINSWSRILLLYIPEDVMFNILSWLPSKSLIRFRSVCKAWHVMISSSRFVNAHLECSKQRPSMLMIPGSFEKQKNGENIAFLMSLYKYQPANIMHLQDFPQGICKWIRPVHCNGLLLISTRKHEMMICNPSTREMISLPKGSHSLSVRTGLGFGFDPHSNKYKVARAFYQRDHGTSRHVCKFEVLTLGTTEWRQTEDPPYPIDRLTPVHVKGAIYWTVCRTPLCPYPPNTFLRFCLTDEKFSLFPCPPCNGKPYCFTEVEGELCCACFFSQTLELEIWTCSVGQNPEWTRCCTVQIPPDLVINHSTEIPPLVVFHGRRLLLASNMAYRYDIQTCKLDKIASTFEDFTCYDPRNSEYQTFLKKEVMDLQKYLLWLFSMEEGSKF